MLSPSPTATPQTRRAESAQRWVSIGLFVLALWVFTFQRNTHFIGDDDYMYASGFAGFARLLHFPDPFDRAGLVDWVRTAGKHIFFLRHGPLPSAFLGVIYRLYEVLSIPFSVRTIHLPVAGLGAAGVVLFYRFLRAQQFSTILSIGGAALLIASPIYAMCSRGIATYFAVGFVCAQILLLYVLEPTRGQPPVWDTARMRALGAFALINLIASDNLFFLAFGALGVALVFAHPLRSLRTLRHPSVWAPAALFLLALSACTAIAHRLTIPGREDATITLIGALFQHTSSFLQDLSLSPKNWYFIAAKLAGEFTPLIFLVTVIVIAIAGLTLVRGSARGSRSPEIRSTTLIFSVIACVGYGLLFYVITGASEWSGALYQIYVLVPALYLFLRALEALEHHLRARASPRIAVTVVACLLVASVVSAGLGQLALIWKLPTSVTGSYGIIGHGINIVDNGAHAAGALIRAAAQTAVAAEKKVPIRIVSALVPGPTGYSPETGYGVAGGYLWNGQWLRAQLGYRGEITYLKTPQATDPACPELPGAMGCVSVQFGEPTTGGTPAVYTITQDAARWVTVVLRSPYPLPDLPTGTYTQSLLGERFAQRFHSFSDFFPHYFERN